MSFGLCVYTLTLMDTNADLWATRACYCLAARQTARAITRMYDEKLRPHGLRSTQFSILAALALGGSSPMRPLADFLGVEHTTLTRSAARLQRDGWIAIGRSADARERVLSVTAIGRAKLEEAFPAWKEVQDYISLNAPQFQIPAPTGAYDERSQQ